MTDPTVVVGKWQLLLKCKYFAPTECMYNGCHNDATYSRVDSRLHYLELIVCDKHKPFTQRKLVKSAAKRAK